MVNVKTVMERNGSAIEGGDVCLSVVLLVVRSCFFLHGQLGREEETSAKCPLSLNFRPSLPKLVG